MVVLLVGAAELILNSHLSDGDKRCLLLFRLKFINASSTILRTIKSGVAPDLLERVGPALGPAVLACVWHDGLAVRVVTRIHPEDAPDFELFLAFTLDIFATNDVRLIAHFLGWLGGGLFRVTVFLNVCRRV